ncbi:LuxR C-terminal-related transcriptional regulator [Pseudofrankia sp. BMG5.36]|uniref:LuxR C-terminal-related transcriptional regulator n=1 Tax=Pseudofrankia sp. BMG5.36 TaxID=1834512 RepID=UPI0008DA8337|nr:LuxR C-terminal-related transcriptional regulator [Pseudofrankia sp. BMG5.36]OHV47397.1 LuxR family transcriptional regulator [Pseudofrankia sp. BMG5.36]
MAASTTVDPPHAPGPGLISRPGLLAALDRATERRVTVISAPAGSGKTSLLRTWAGHAATDRRIVFLTVRPGQADPHQFWLALLAAIRAACHADPPSPTPDFDGPTMVAQVLGELAALDGATALIIDDLHELHSTSAIEHLTELLANLPAAVHAAVATRHDSPLRLHRLRLDGELAEIRAAQLTFTASETRQLLSAAGVDLPERLVAVLHQRTEGWAAGLRLAALSLSGNPDPAGFVAEFSGTDRTVAEYLMAEMLDRQPADVQRLLLRTSVLDRINGELADLLTGATGSEGLLLDLEDTNAFVVSLDPGRTWFRFHHLVADMLALQLRRTEPGQVPKLHRLAAGWLTERNHPVEAIGHLQAAGDWSAAARLLTDHALSLTLDGHAATVTSLLQAFPAPIRDTHPDLALVDTIADLDRMRLDHAAAHLDTVRTYAATSPAVHRDQLNLAIASLDLLLARLRGHFDGVIAQIDTLSSAGTIGGGLALGADLRALALMNLGVTEAWSLRLADSERHLRDGAALAHDINRPYLEVACRAHLGFAAIAHSFGQARQHCEDAIALAARHGWATAPVIAPALATLAGTLIWTGELDHGRQWLDQARTAAHGGGEPGLELLLHLVDGVSYAARGQHPQALTAFTTAARVQTRMAGRHGLTTWVTAWTIATQARLGLLDQAAATLATVDPDLAATGEMRNATAALHLAAHQPDAARHALRPVLDGTAPVNPYLTRVEAHLLDALAHRDLGDLPAARACVEQALEIAGPDRLIAPFSMTGAWQLLEMAPSRATAHAALIADIRDAVHGTTPATPAVAPGQPHEQLSPSELRVLRYLPTNLTRPEIAHELSVSVNTINTHIRHIYTKLGATGRSSAVDRGRELRLLATGHS